MRIISPIHNAYCNISIAHKKLEKTQMAINLRLARKGADEPRKGLIQQAKYHAKLASDKSDDLQRVGWKMEKTKQLQNDILALESQSAEQADNRGSATKLTLSESAARTQAKAFIRKLRNALPTVLRDNPDTDVSLDIFNKGTLAQSTPKISGFLNEVSGPVGKLDGLLVDYFDGKSALEQLTTAKKNLDDADTIQETTLAGLPEATLQIYETKGRVLEAIEDINRLAKNAFDGQAHLIGQFNKDILLRARQEKPTKPDDAKAAG
jgi:hypothetical protein